MRIGSTNTIEKSQSAKLRTNKFEGVLNGFDLKLKIPILLHDYIKNIKNVNFKQLKYSFLT